MLQTLVAEIYGPSEEGRLARAAEIKRIMEQTPGVVDVDWYVEDEQPKQRFIVDREKAALHGLSTGDVARALRLAAGGETAGLAHAAHSLEDVLIEVRLPEEKRSAAAQLAALKLRTPGGRLVSVDSLTRLESVKTDRNRYRTSHRYRSCGQ